MRELRIVAGSRVVLDTDVDRFLGDTRQFIVGPGEPAKYAMWWSDVFRHDSGVCYLWDRSRWNDDDDPGALLVITPVSAVEWLVNRCGVPYFDACKAVGVDPADESVIGYYQVNERPAEVEAAEVEESADDVVPAPADPAARVEELRARVRAIGLEVEALLAELERVAP